MDAETINEAPPFRHLHRHLYISYSLPLCLSNFNLNLSLFFLFIFAAWLQSCVIMCLWMAVDVDWYVY